MTPKLRFAVFERDGGCCVICGHGVAINNFEAHHRKFRSRGGADELCNLITLCPSWLSDCHDVHAHREGVAATCNGWAVPSTEDPAAIPVRYADGSFRLLSNEIEVAA